MIAAILIIAGCGLDYQGPGDPAAKTVLVLSFNKATVKTILPDVTMDVTSYDVTGTTTGDSFSETIGADGVLALEGLAVGTWLIHVDAKNDAGVIIADGDISLEILAGQTISETVTVTPLEGDGTLNLTIDWSTANQFTNAAEISGSLTPAGGSPVTLNFSTTGQTAINTNTTWAKGYYTLTLGLIEGDAEGSYTDVVRIVYNATTAATIMIEDVSYTGGLILTIDNDLDNPIAITLSGPTSTSPDSPITVTSSCDPTPTSYQWYLDGVLQAGETNSSITIAGGTLSARETAYRLSLHVALDDILSSEAHYFTVGEVVPDGTYEAEDGECGGEAGVMEDYYVGNMNIDGAWNKVSSVNGGGTGGNATLKIVYATEYSDGTKNLYVNDVKVATVAFAHSGGWTTFVEYSVDISLNAGMNTIMLKNDTENDNEGLNIDKYIIGAGGTPTSSSSTPPSSSSLSSDGDVIVLQAEDGNFGGGAAVQDEGGTICIGSMQNPGAFSEVTVNSAGGSTTLAITYATDADGVTKSLYINDVDVQQLSFSKVGWTNFVDMDVTVTLIAGDNTIKIQNDADDNEGVNLDKYTVGGGSTPSSTSSVSSSSSDEESVTYEAEAGTLDGGAVVMDDYYVGNMNADSASITINNVDGGSGGSTNLTVMFATDLAGPYTKSLYVNGSDVETLSFTSSGGWTTFAEYSVTITLNAGTTNTIMIKNDADDDNEGVNIDKLIVGAGSPPASSSSEPPVSGTYQAEDGNYGGGAGVQDEGGTICIGSMQNPGAFSEVVNVDGGTGGSATLIIRYATDADGVTKSLYVNGTDVLQVSFPKVGWTNFVDSAAITVTLTAGTTNTIKLQNDADDNEGVNIDYYSIQ